MGETCSCGRQVEDHFPLDCFNDLRNGWDKADATVEKLANDFSAMTDLSNATIARLQEALAAANARADAAEAKLIGMTGERDSEREIALGWESKAEDAEEALAAARRECEGLRKALTAFRRLHKKCSKGPTREGRCQPCRDADAALAAHGDGEEPDPSLDDGSFYEQGGGGHDD